MYCVPSGERSDSNAMSINSFHRWEQAFRVFSRAVHNSYVL